MLTILGGVDMMSWVRLHHIHICVRGEIDWEKHTFMPLARLLRLPQELFTGVLPLATVP